jgi:hypothetical protein
MSEGGLAVSRGSIEQYAPWHFDLDLIVDEAEFIWFFDYAFYCLFGLGQAHDFAEVVWVGWVVWFAWGSFGG